MLIEPSILKKSFSPHRLTQVIQGSARPAQPNIPSRRLCDTNHVQESTARTTPLLTSARQPDQVQRVVSREKRSPPERQTFQKNQVVSAIPRLNKERYDLTVLAMVGSVPVATFSVIGSDICGFIGSQLIALRSRKNLWQFVTHTVSNMERIR